MSSLISRLLLCIVFSIAAHVVPVLSAECYRGSFSATEFPHCQLLSSTFALHWNVKGENVTFGLDVDEDPVSGWVGFGVSEGGGMRGSDLWVVSQTKPGEWMVNDMYSLDFGPPTPDTKQDVTLLGTTTTNGNRTAVTITRALKACDTDDLSIFPNMSTAFVWAHAAAEGYHGPVNRGTVHIRLDQAKEPEPAATAELIEVRMKNVVVPSNSTTYLCKNFLMPHDRKYHIVATAFNISSELVHHLVLFGCPQAPSQGIGKVYECPNMPAECSLFTMGWAPGVQTWVAPPEAGMPMYQYYALQVHYNNPEGVKGQPDASGLMIYYTPKLRQHDTAVLTLGQMNLTIPPATPMVAVPPGVCPGECTSKFTAPLTILKHAFHMHTLGKTITTRVVRDGKELAPLGMRHSWDFNFQDFSDPAPGTNMLMPGDTLITECTYDSSKKNTTTRFGESTNDEMCFDFLLYYPAQDVTSCLPLSNSTSVCANDVKYGMWIQEEVTKMSSTNATTKPTATTMKSSNADKNTTTSSNTSVGLQDQLALMTQLTGLAVKAGYAVQYDPAKYQAGSGFTPYMSSDGCPSFMSAANVRPGVPTTPQTSTSPATPTMPTPTTPTPAAPSPKGAAASDGDALSVSGCMLLGVGVVFIWQYMAGLQF